MTTASGVCEYDCFVTNISSVSEFPRFGCPRVAFLLDKSFHFVTKRFVSFTFPHLYFGELLTTPTLKLGVNLYFPISIRAGTLVFGVIF